MLSQMLRQGQNFSFKLQHASIHLVQMLCISLYPANGAMGLIQGSILTSDLGFRSTHSVTFPKTGTGGKNRNLDPGKVFLLYFMSASDTRWPGHH